jgi:hypothetical protein
MCALAFSLLTKQAEHIADFFAGPISFVHLSHNKTHHPSSLAHAQCVCREAPTAAATAAVAQPQSNVPAKQGAPKAALPSAEATLALIKSRRSVFPKDYNGKKLSKPQVRSFACVKL